MAKKRGLKKNNQAWIIAADMGYGHQRAAYPLKDIAYERIINANSDKSISREDVMIWDKARWFYEWISRMTELPLIGNFLFNLFNRIQEIDPYYPRRPNKNASFQVKYLEKKIRKGFCKSLITHVKQKNIPFITTFYIPAIAANYHKLENAYCVITDTDINRVWVPNDPETCVVTYFAPCRHAYNRLLSYGLKPEKIILTGFPLPKENIGPNSEITKKAMSSRLINLDPTKSFIFNNKESIKQQIKYFNINKKPVPITITFVVGGAGAQKEIGADILKSLKQKIFDGRINVCLVAGTHLDVKGYFMEEIEKEGLTSRLNINLSVLCELSKKDYFLKFNEQLNRTDVLWTKPSELSFYSGLGLPIIISPHIGSQEAWNKKWLFEVGAGIDQEDPKYVSDWIEEWLSDGRLARKAWQGFSNAPRMGTYEIENIIFGKK
jgi:hypothetical protein